MEKMDRKSYVLVTTARNEEQYLPRILTSVIQQTLLPEKWIIVSDGSTDRTDDIIAEYADAHDYIELVRVAGHTDRNFASKVNAFRAGWERLRGVEYNFIGNLDADVSFGPEYFEAVVDKFLENPKLGIGGGTILEAVKGVLTERTGNRGRSVAGAVQLFRRRCFEQIGGFVAMPAGGEDTVAEISARMNGWEVSSFPEIQVCHHRRTGTQGLSIWRVRYRQGQEDYVLGYGRFFYFIKCLGRILEKPYLVGSVMRMIGYGLSSLKKVEIPLSDSFLQFHRREQRDRLLAMARITNTHQT